VKLRISDFGLWNEERLKAQGARPKVKEINSSFFRYALCGEQE
jgi:hypothetical protein